MAAHSMEEAETLCDRLCIMVDGSLQCIGTPKEVVPHHHIYDYITFLMIELRQLCSNED